MPYSMLVLKRDGRKETVSFDKVLGRVRKASKGLAVNPDALAQQVLAQIFDGVKTSELDELTASGSTIRMIVADTEAIEAMGPNSLDPRFRRVAAEHGRRQGRITTF